ncbi:Acrylyl-CoA reductase AcuI [compost metagenome]
MDFPGSVAPFILRGVTLAGINSVTQPKARRIAAWDRLARDLDLGLLSLISHEIALSDAIDLAPRLLAGEVRGRVVVDVNR